MGDWLDPMNLIPISATSYTFKSGDEQCTLVFSSPTGCVVTVPTNASIFFPAGTSFACIDETGLASHGLIFGGPGAGATGGSAAGVTLVSYLNAYRSAGNGIQVDIIRSLTADKWYIGGGLVV